MGDKEMTRRSILSLLSSLPLLGWIKPLESEQTSTSIDLELACSLANMVLIDAFVKAKDDALVGVKVEYVPDFKIYGEKPQLKTYVKLVRCRPGDLESTCVRLGETAGKKLREVIANLGRPARCVTFLNAAPHPIIDSVQEEDGYLVLRGYFDFGVSG